MAVLVCPPTDELRQFPKVLLHGFREPAELGQSLAPLPKPR